MKTKIVWELDDIVRGLKVVYGKREYNPSIIDFRSWRLMGQVISYGEWWWLLLDLEDLEIVSKAGTSKADILYFLNEQKAVPFESLKYEKPNE